jgi:type II secretory pathway pseudopilin PulG
MSMSKTLSPKKRRGPRGYLMIEAVVGGAIVAVAISALLSQLAYARKQTYLAEREIEAQQLVTQKYEQSRAAGYGALPTALVTETITLGGASYKRFTNSAVVSPVEQMNGVNMPARDVTITICAPANLCTAPTTAVLSLSTITVKLQQRFRMYAAVN